MKVQLILPLSIAVSLASLGLMKVRLKELSSEEKKAKFHDVKLRVTDDVLTEYEKEKKSIEATMEREKVAQKGLQQALTELSTEALTNELQTCTGELKTATDEVAAAQTALKTFQEDSAKEKAGWDAEIAALQEKLKTESPICKYLKTGSSLEGVCPGKKEEPKAEPEKPAEEKKDAPKAEENKPEPQKPAEEKKEEAKAEPQKPAEEKKEEAKAEPQKPAEEKKEEAKAEPPKPAEEKKEEAKAEPQKPAEEKKDAPKAEEPPKQEAPKP